MNPQSDRSSPPDRLPASTYRGAINHPANSLRYGDDLKFRYRMDGGPWRTEEEVRTAGYTGLSAGAHRIEIQATIDGQTWHTFDVLLDFTTAPRFYQTWWFRILMSVVLLTMTIGAYRWWTYRLRAQKQQIRDIVDSRTATLRARTEALETENAELEAQVERLAQAKSQAQGNLSDETQTTRTSMRGPYSDAEVGETDDEEESDFLREVRSVVETHVDNSNFGVAWLAEEVGLSRRQLQRKVKSETGLTAAAYVRALRLQHAACLLKDGTVTTVKDAAEAVGYRDPSHLSQIFEDAFGRSPSDVIAERTSGKD